MKNAFQKQNPYSNPENHTHNHKPFILSTKNSKLSPFNPPQQEHSPIKTTTKKKRTLSHSNYGTTIGACPVDGTPPLQPPRKPNGSADEKEREKPP
ncbi:hypothetical protein JTE90_011360 [Oedothorax gibbosus]|uniref:Uncharacterized protein n=1 Tax=Oedothorax gibbosus TaxID=931172 RepID=A0AAV6VK49_9ARAC|nr:hypothetical protein JTE90_011360 [Oedothorax gibbosus]